MQPPEDQRFPLAAEHLDRGLDRAVIRDAAAFGEILLNCTQGAISLDVLCALDRRGLNRKVLIDVANPLDVSSGAPILTICNRDSIGESIQREFPKVKVVKALNTVNCSIMIDPGRVPGEHDLFICGNDTAAKETVRQLLHEFGWKSIIDLSDITNFRGTQPLCRSGFASGYSSALPISITESNRRSASRTSPRTMRNRIRC